MDDAQEKKLIDELISICGRLEQSMDPMVRQGIRRLIPALLELQEDINLSVSPTIAWGAKARGILGA